MSPRKTEVEEPEEESAPGERSQMWIHEAHIEFLLDEYGDDVLARKKPHQIIAIAFATRRTYRDSQIYADAKEANEVAKSEAEDERKAEVAERKAERAAVAAEKAKAKKGEAKPKAKGKSKAATKGKATRTRPSRSKAAPAEEEDPFED